jgi:hypothetical protein
MAKSGTTPCTLEELCFPVEIIDNPANTNREYSKIVRGKVIKHVPMTNEEIEQYLIEANENEILIEAQCAINGTEYVKSKIIKPKTKKVEIDMDLNYCSPVYELVPNSEIFPKVEEILNAHGIKFSVNYSHTNNTRFYGNFIIEDPRFSYTMEGTNDVIKFVWNFQHSYNGLTKYKGEAGFFRLICSNGLTIPVQEMGNFNLCIQGKHTSSIIHSLEQFSNTLTYAIENLTEVKTSIVKRYENLGGSWIADPRERIEVVLNVAKINALDNSKFNTINDIMGRITKESTDVALGYHGKVNDWLIYNAINAYIHDDNRNIAAPEKRREVDSKVLEYMLESVE